MGGGGGGGGYAELNVLVMSIRDAQPFFSSKGCEIQTTNVNKLRFSCDLVTAF